MYYVILSNTCTNLLFKYVFIILLQGMLIQIIEKCHNETLKLPICLSAVKYVKLNKQGKICQEILQQMEKTAGYCKPAGHQQK